MKNSIFSKSDRPAFAALIACVFATMPFASPAPAQNTNQANSTESNSAEANQAETDPAVQEAAEEPLVEPILVAVKQAEPFVIATEAGWDGISIELWEQIAERTGIEYEFTETDLEGMLEGVAAGEYGAGVAATTVTAEREASVDFTHPFYEGGLAIAVSSDHAGLSVVAMLGQLISPGFLTAVASLAVVLAGVGLLVWLVERRANPDQFGGSVVKGIGSGFWFSAVTMTTVGYGDKAPISPLGRFLALVWMFVSIIIISFFTGAIASAFTTSQLTGAVKGPEDLPRAEVGALSGSASTEVLRNRGVDPVGYDSIEAGLDALADGDIDAFVHDEPIIRYLVNRDYEGSISVLEATFERQPYAIALPPSSERREAINQALLEAIASEEYQRVVDRYLDGG